MKQLLVAIFLLFAVSSQAQVKVPNIAKLIKLYEDTNSVAIDNYANELGYKGKPAVHHAVGNTYEYRSYVFASKDSTGKQATYLEYSWGEHYPMFGYRLTNITYATNSQAVYDSLIDELLKRGAVEIPMPGADVGAYQYKLDSAFVNTYQTKAGNALLYNIRVGGG